MFAAEVETKGPLFPAFLRLRERVFRAPEQDWRADDAAHELGVSKGYFHVLLEQAVQFARNVRLKFVKYI